MFWPRALTRRRQSFSPLPPITRASRRGCWRCRRCSSMPIWSTRWRPAVRRSRWRWRAARRCRGRSPRPSPKSAPRKPAWCSWKMTLPTSRRRRPIASSSASVISPRSASRCWRAPIWRWRRAHPPARAPPAARWVRPPAPREPLLARDDLAVATRQTLVAKLSDTLAGFVAGRAWLDLDHAQRITREACEKATVAIAADSATSEVRPLIRHLRVTGQLTAGLILRALLSGNVVLFEEALAELADMPVARVSGLIHDRGNAGLRALFERAALPSSTYPAFKAAIEARRKGGFASERGDAARLKRRMIERVLTRCEDQDLGELEPLLTLLRRFATEAAREEARLFCDGVVAERLEADDCSVAA